MTSNQIKTNKPSGGNMATFIYGKPKGRFVGNRRKRKVRGMKK